MPMRALGWRRPPRGRCFVLSSERQWTPRQPRARIAVLAMAERGRRPDTPPLRAIALLACLGAGCGGAQETSGAAVHDGAPAQSTGRTDATDEGSSASDGTYVYWNDTLDP